MLTKVTRPAANLAMEAMAANFWRWHDLQLNIAEWTPTFGGLMVRARPPWALAAEPPLSCNRDRHASSTT